MSLLTVDLATIQPSKSSWSQVRAVPYAGNGEAISSGVSVPVPRGANHVEVELTPSSQYRQPGAYYVVWVDGVLLTPPFSMPDAAVNLSSLLASELARADWGYVGTSPPSSRVVGKSWWNPDSQTLSVFADDEWQTVHVAAGSVTGDHLADGSVTFPKLHPDVDESINDKVELEPTDISGRDLTFYSGGGGSKSLTLPIAEWAETDNTDPIPAAKLANAPQGSGGGGLNQAAVDARVQALVSDWGETDNTDPIPAAKLTNAPGTGEDEDLRDALSVPTSLGRGTFTSASSNAAYRLTPSVQVPDLATNPTRFQKVRLTISGQAIKEFELADLKAKGTVSQSTQLDSSNSLQWVRAGVQYSVAEDAATGEFLVASGDTGLVVTVTISERQIRPGNVNSDWDATDGDAAILNKPSIPPAPAVWAEADNDDLIPDAKVPNHQDGLNVVASLGFNAGTNPGGDFDYGGNTNAGTLTFAEDGATYTVRRITWTADSRKLSIKLSVNGAVLSNAERANITDLFAVFGTAKYQFGSDFFNSEVSGISEYEWNAATAPFGSGAQTLKIERELTGANFLPEGGTEGQLVTPTAGDGRAWKDVGAFVKGYAVAGSTVKIPDSELSAKTGEIINAFDGDGWTNEGDTAATDIYVSGSEYTAKQTDSQIPSLLWTHQAQNGSADSNIYIYLRVPKARGFVFSRDGSRYRLLWGALDGSSISGVQNASAWTFRVSDSDYDYYESALIQNLPASVYHFVQHYDRFTISKDKVEGLAASWAEDENTDPVPDAKLSNVEDWALDDTSPIPLPKLRNVPHSRTLHTGAGAGITITNTGITANSPFTLFDPAFDLDDVGHGEIDIEARLTISTRSSDTLGFGSDHDTTYRITGIVFASTLKGLGTFAIGDTTTWLEIGNGIVIEYGSVKLGKQSLYLGKNANGHLGYFLHYPGTGTAAQNLAIGNVLGAQWSPSDVPASTSDFLIAASASPGTFQTGATQDWGAWTTLVQLQAITASQAHRRVEVIAHSHIECATNATDGADRCMTETKLVRTRNSAEMVLSDNVDYGPRRLHQGSAAFIRATNIADEEHTAHDTCMEGDVYSLQVRTIRGQKVGALTFNYTTELNNISVHGI